MDDEIFIDLDEDREDNSAEDAMKFSNAVDAIKDRCRKAEISFTEEDGEDFGYSLEIEVPAGRKKRTIYIHDVEDAEWLLSFDFENWVYLEQFDAVCTYGGKKILAEISALDGFYRHWLPKALFPAINAPADREGGSTQALSREVILTDIAHPGIKISLAPAGNELKIFSRAYSRPGAALQLSIEGCQISTNQEAENILKKVANSVFLKIEAEIEVPLGLVRKREFNKRKKRDVPSNSISISFPKFQFDPDPMTLYWYGAGASRAPLMQFLAYYQVIEYYYSTYSDIIAKRSIQGIIKSVNFNPDRDSDVAKLVAAVRQGAGKGGGGEKASLRAVLRECVPESEIRRFFQENPTRSEFLSKSKILNVQRINIIPTNAEIVREVADRIYELRCRIVHTKGNEDEKYADPLLPYTSEEAQLMHDIDLVKFCARQVLSMSSSPMRIEG